MKKSFCILLEINDFIVSFIQYLFLQQMETEILNCFGIEAVVFSPIKISIALWWI
jgi:hypothetical protein